jgi:thiol-disulfide isomerase/thioredoxin
MVAKKSKKMKGTNHVDVRSAEDIALLNDIFGKNQMTVVLVYADYCGHCHTYKDNVWNDLVADKNRKHGMASIHYDQLEKTPLANTKVSGYPTVLVLGENKSPIKFKNAETGEEEVDYPESKNKENMTHLLNSEDPGSVLTNSAEPEPESIAENTNIIDNSSMEKRQNGINAKSIVNSIVKEKANLKPKKMASVPNYREDINSESVEFNENAGATPTPGKGTAVGGSLYRALLESITPAKRHTRRNKAKKGRKTRRHS